MRNKKLLVFAASDLYSFVLAVIVAMWVGGGFSPNLPAFLIFFLGINTAIFYYRQNKDPKTKPNWLRFFISRAILLSATPMLIGVSAIASFKINNIVFWLLIVPLFFSVASLLLHFLYRISPGEKG